MTKYDIIFEALQEKVNSGELTLEDGQILNDLAFEKYKEYTDECIEVIEEATRLAKEIDKKESDISSHINDLQTHLNSLRKSLKSTTDRIKREDIANEIDETVALIQKLNNDKENVNSINTLKHGKELKPIVKKYKDGQKRIEQEYEDADRRLHEALAKDRELRQEKNLLKRLGNHKAIIDNRDDIRDLNNEVILHSVRKLYANRDAKHEYMHGLDSGKDKKTKQRNDKDIYRRAKYHLKQADSSLNNKNK